MFAEITALSLEGEIHRRGFRLFADERTSPAIARRIPDELLTLRSRTKPVGFASDFSFFHLSAESLINIQALANVCAHYALREHEKK